MGELTIPENYSGCDIISQNKVYQSTLCYSLFEFMVAFQYVHDNFDLTFCDQAGERESHTWCRPCGHRKHI